MKILILPLALSAIHVSSLNLREGGRKTFDQVYINDPKPDSREESTINLFDASEPALLSEVTWPGGICPTLPADPASDGWVLAMDPNNSDNILHSEEQSIGFDFNLFGKTYNTFWILDDGVLYFPKDYESPFHPIFVGPFVSEVDTRNDHGKVWMKQLVPSRNVYLAAWNSVGYYEQHGDKRNTFMVMISDGNDPGMGVGNNICFCYEDMQWATGDWWGGVDGFGGDPALIGISGGAGRPKFEFGRYDSPGAGPQGIDLLDGQSFCFSASNINQPPVAIGVPAGNQIELECDGSIVDKAITFSGPVTDQLVSLSVIPSGDDSELTIVIDDNKQTASLTINWSPSTAGTIQLEITATDNDSTDPKTAVVDLDLIYPGPCNSPPVALCRDVDDLEATTDCTATPSESELIGLINNGSNDPDVGDSITLSAIRPSEPFTPGTHEVVLTVTDSHGASNSCESTITVIDNETPEVNCGDIGIIAPCEVPITMNFAAKSKDNGCPVNVESVHEKCSFCNPSGKEVDRDCIIDGTTVMDSGGVKDHISWIVTATNEYSGQYTPISTQETCTVCVQNPTSDFEPGCSGKDPGSEKKGNQYVCDSSCPQCELQCSNWMSTKASKGKAKKSHVLD